MKWCIKCGKSLALGEDRLALYNHEEFGHLCGDVVCEKCYEEWEKLEEGDSD